MNDVLNVKRSTQVTLTVNTYTTESEWRISQHVLLVCLYPHELRSHCRCALNIDLTHSQITGIFISAAQNKEMCGPWGETLDLIQWRPAEDMFRNKSSQITTVSYSIYYDNNVKNMNPKHICDLYIWKWTPRVILLHAFLSERQTKSKLVLLDVRFGKVLVHQHKPFTSVNEHNITHIHATGACLHPDLHHMGSSLSLNACIRTSKVCSTCLQTSVRLFRPLRRGSDAAIPSRVWMRKLILLSDGCVML